MPTLGGITAWISIGDVKLDEIGVDIADDKATCYIEVPAPAPEQSISPIASAASPSSSPPPHSPATAPAGAEYAINWKISDLTYSLVVKAVVDGVLEIEKIHLGRGTITAAKNTGRIDAVPVTDDWSKRRLLTFVKLQAAENAKVPKEDVGSIKLSFYRAGRAAISGGIKTSATGFHRSGTVDPNTLFKRTTVDGLYSKSHATGLGSITFGPPKKVPSVSSRDDRPYVSFVFLYRSRELIAEIAPEDWVMTVPPPAVNFNKDLPAVKTDPSSTAPGGTVGSSMSKRPSIAVRAKKWASDVKQSAQSVRIVKHAPERKIEIVNTPLDAIRDPFTPRDRLPRIPVPDGEEPVEVPHDDVELAHSDSAVAATDSDAKPDPTI